MRVKIFSLLCAVALQLVPCARHLSFAVRAALPETPAFVRLLIAGIAGLGAFDSVSGGSTIIVSPSTATGVVGQAFSYRIALVGHAASIFRAAPLPPGLAMDRSLIVGAPTVPGETRVKLTASDGSHAVIKWITIDILPPPESAPPVFDQQPADQSALPGEVTTFHSSVISLASPTFQWMRGSASIVGATNSDLTFLNDGTVFVGAYSVIASNPFGAVTSAPVQLFLRVPIVEAAAAWSYADNGKSLGTVWRKPAFKDATWRVGHVPFGYGWGDEATVVSAGANPLHPIITTYFRRPFVITDSNAFTGFQLSLQADDGAVVYLNTKELLRFNIPRGPISARTFATAGRDNPADHEWYSTNILRPFVLQGTNVLAVEVHQARNNGSDMRFDLRFSGLVSGQ